MPLPFFSSIANSIKSLGRKGLQSTKKFLKSVRDTADKLMKEIEKEERRIREASKKAQEKLKEFKEKTREELKKLKERLEKERKQRKLKQLREQTKREIERVDRELPLGIGIISIRLSPHGYYYLATEIRKLRTTGEMKERLDEIREDPDVVAVWVITTEDVIKGRARGKIKRYQKSIINASKTLGEVTTPSGVPLTPTIVKGILKGVVKTLKNITKGGGRIVQRSISEWVED